MNIIIIIVVIITSQVFDFDGYWVSIVLGDGPVLEVVEVLETREREEEVIREEVIIEVVTREEVIREAVTRIEKRIEEKRL